MSFRVVGKSTIGYNSTNNSNFIKSLKIITTLFSSKAKLVERPLNNKPKAVV